jgi:uncharacterized protein YxjI
MKKILISAFLLLSSFSVLKAQIAEMPQQFMVKQHWISLTSSFDVESKDRRFGTIHRKFLSLTPIYQFYDFNDNLQATAKMRFFSFGATFDIFDGNDQPLGRVEEKLFTFFHTFELFRNDGYLAAKAALNFWGTKYTVRDPQTDEEIAHLWRNFFRLKDDWTVDIINPQLFAEKQIDPRLFMLVMAFQTDLDHWSSYRHYQYQNNSACNFDGKTVSTEYATLHQNLEQHHSKLENYRAMLCDIEPTQEEVNSLEELVEKRLNDHVSDLSQTDVNPRCNESKDVVRLRIMERGISVLMPLLDSDELTPGQKSALFLLMEDKLN